MKSILGIAGKAGSGKSTFADAICQTDPDRVVVVALADGMKRLAKDLFGFTDEQLWGPSPKRNELVTPARIGTTFTFNDFARMFDINANDRVNQTWSKWIGGFFGKDFKPRETSPREVLQQMGTELGRALDPNMWVRYTVKVADQLLGGGYTYTRQGGLEPAPAGYDAYYNTVIIGDVRFRNEVLEIRRAGGGVVKVERPGADNGMAHRSEVELETIPTEWFDRVILNDGTVEDLVTAARWFR